MKQFEVLFERTIVQNIRVEVLADDEKDAINNVKNGEYLNDGIVYAETCIKYDNYELSAPPIKEYAIAFEKLLTNKDEK